MVARPKAVLRVALKSGLSNLDTARLSVSRQGWWKLNLG